MREPLLLPQLRSLAAPGSSGAGIQPSPPLSRCWRIQSRSHPSIHTPLSPTGELLRASLNSWLEFLHEALPGPAPGDGKSHQELLQHRHATAAWRESVEKLSGVTSANLAVLPGDAVWAQGWGDGSISTFSLSPSHSPGRCGLGKEMNLCPVPRGRSNCDYSPSGMTAENKQTPLPGPTARLHEARGKALGQRDNEELG